MDDEKKTKKARRGRGEGGVYQRESDGLWVGTVSLGYGDEGKRVRRTVYGTTKNEAMKKLRKLQDQAAKGVIANPTKLTVSQFLDAWLDGIKPSVAPGTHTAYRQHVENLIKPRIGSVKLDALNPLHVSGLYTQLADGGYSTAMQRKAGITLRAAVSWAVETRIVADNPVKRVKLPVHKVEEVKPMEPGELAKFMAVVKADRLYALYVLAVDSGCRQGELLALEWRDVDLDFGMVAVTKSLEEVGGTLRIKEPKSVKARRTLTISPFTVAVLKKHKEAMVKEKSYRPDGPVFCGSRNKTYLRKSDVYRHSFQPALEAAGVTFKFHALRHACATFLLSAGANVKLVQERLGHSTAVMTLNTYSHVLAGAQAEAAKKLDAVLVAAHAEKKTKG